MRSATSADGFADLLVPSFTIASAATRFAAMLQPDGMTTIEKELREAFVDSFVKSEMPSSPKQQQDHVKRAALRVVAQAKAGRPVWTSVTTTRAAIALGLWQSAVEDALVTAGAHLCRATQGVECPHEPQGFSRKWSHFIDALHAIDTREAERLLPLHESAVLLTRYRNDVLHGELYKLPPDVREADPAKIVLPFSELHSAVVSVTLRNVFRDDNPERTFGGAAFGSFGIERDFVQRVLSK